MSKYLKTRTDPYNLKTSDPYNAQKGYGELDNKRWIITSDLEEQERLIRYIEAWMKHNRVGYEEGKHKDDPKGSSGRYYKDNTIGSIAHQDPAGIAPNYWVYGQNCFWWANKMISDADISTSESLRAEIGEMNAGIGTLRRFTDNTSAKFFFSQKGSWIKRMFRTTTLFDNIHMYRVQSSGLRMKQNESTDRAPSRDLWY